MGSRKLNLVGAMTAFGLIGVLAQPPVWAVNPATGRFAIAEISGAVMWGPRLAVVADEDNGLFLLEQPDLRLAQPEILPAQSETWEKRLYAAGLKQDDIEELAVGPGNELYLFGSQSRNKAGDPKPKRLRVGKITLGPNGLPQVKQSDRLLSGLVMTFPFLGDAVRRTPAQSGLNVEGATFDEDGELVLGFRSPTITSSEERKTAGQEDAVVVRLKNPQDLFTDLPLRFESPMSLDLRGQGIRGVCRDGKNFWIVAGMAVDPNHEVKSEWALWRWDGEAAPVQVPIAGAEKLANVEAVALVPRGGVPGLLLVEDGKPASRYLWVPKSDLK